LGDISVIFRNYTLFKAKMDDIKRDAQAAEKSLAGRRAEIAAKAKKLETYRTSSPEYKRLEEELATLQSQWTLDAKLTQKHFMEQEAKTYYDVYQQVRYEVERFARQYGYSLVLRYSSKKIDPGNRQEVLAGVYKPVVFHNNLDITYSILDRMNQQVPNYNRTVERPSGTSTIPERHR